MRIERNGQPRRWLGVLDPRQGGHVGVTVALPSADALFQAPVLDPLSPGDEAFEDRAAIDALAFELQADRIPTSVHTTLELPEQTLDAGLAEQLRPAVRRYCARRLEVLDTELRRVHRHGLRGLVLGFAAVVLLNAVATSIGDSRDDFVQAFATGLQVVSWVTLWFPVNLLVYDRWYYSRERKVFRVLRDMDLTVVPLSRSLEPAGRSTAPSAQ